MYSLTWTIGSKIFFFIKVQPLLRSSTEELLTAQVIETLIKLSSTLSLLVAGHALCQTVSCSRI